MPVPDLDQRIDRVRAELTALAARPEVRDAFRTFDELERSDLGVAERADARNAVVRRLGHLGVEHHRYRLEPPVARRCLRAPQRHPAPGGLPRVHHPDR
jgi:hypothetical protein